MPLSKDALTAPPDPTRAGSLDDLVERMRLLKVWAGNPSYETIKDRVNVAWTAAGRPVAELVCKSTVAYCFRPGRRRLDTDLVVAVVRALHPDTGYVTQWRQALRVIGGEIEAVSQVRVQDSLPQDLAGFTGRTEELDRLRHAVRGGQAVVISAIEGMAGVGKTQLAVHAGHLLHQQQPFERVLFVNLRGFDPDPALPPADPAAVLDGFLRLLGMPGQQIPHTLDARAAAYRDRLTGVRALVVLDNAATTEQVRPLLPATPGCLTLVTSRRSLADLHPTTHLTVDAFTPDEALAYLAQAVPAVPAGADLQAAARIARCCGYLPLALSLIAGHVRNTPGWTLTDHADRLDERHHQRRLDTGVELALNLSYQHLPGDQRRLLRLLALHPGQDSDAYAAAALADTDLATTRTLLGNLHRDHLLQQNTPGRYTFHDLIRAYATSRAADEDPPLARRVALTRLFDHCLGTAAAAMNALYPAEASRRPRIPPAGTPVPDLADPRAALAWLDIDRTTLVAIATHTATHGWATHTTRLSRVLHRYFITNGHLIDALTVHGHACDAARRTGDPAAQGHALTFLGGICGQLGRYETAVVHLRQALALHRKAGDLTGEAGALNNLGNVEQLLGDYRAAGEHIAQALALHRKAGDLVGEAGDLNNLGIVEQLLGNHSLAADHLQQALTLFRQVGNRVGEASALTNLGQGEKALRRYAQAAEYLQEALSLRRQAGYRLGEGWTLDSLGALHVGLAQPREATEHYHRALAIFRETGDRPGEASALNGLGEAAHRAGGPAEALTHHTAAHSAATAIGSPAELARAHTGLGHAHRTLRDPVRARHHYQHALTIYADLGLPEADQIRTHLTALDLTATGRG
ncbi:tetratricopeptide repeat protein [Actinoplanes sp. NPDC048967]|uniref:tetratricopeptide repeat protein n=1 Tax=Actinoplanes sp. NPDC048967 TaxID=3155269 RepID=UPI0033E5E6A1